MTLQNIFYILAIICMLLALGILIAIAILVFYIKKKITQIHNQIENKINTLTRGILQPSDVAVGVGSKVAEIALDTVKGMFRKRKKT